MELGDLVQPGWLSSREFCQRYSKMAKIRVKISSFDKGKTPNKRCFTYSTNLAHNGTPLFEVFTVSQFLIWHLDVRSNARLFPYFELFIWSPFYWLGLPVVKISRLYTKPLVDLHFVIISLLSTYFWNTVKVSNAVAVLRSRPILLRS